MTLKRILTAVLLGILLFKSGMFVFAAAIPFFFLFAVYGRKTGWSSIAVMTALLPAGVAFNIIEGLDAAYFGYFLLIAIILGEGVVRHASVLKLAAAAVFVPWLLAMSVFAMLQFGAGVQIISSVSGYLQQSVDMALSVQGGVAAFSPSQIAYVREHSTDIATFALRTLPAFMMLFGVAVVSLTLAISRALTKKFGALKYFGNVAVTKFPFFTVWATIVFGAAFFADAYFSHNVYARYLAINGMFCCAGIYFIQGCFILSFWLKKWRSPVLRLAAYTVVIAFLQVVGFIIIMLGLSDNWIDFRKKGKVTTVA